MLEAVLDQVLDFIVDNFWGSIAFWRSAAIVLFVFLSVLFAFRKNIVGAFRRDTTVSHDRDIFKRSDSSLNEEQFREIIDALGRHEVRSYQSEGARRLCRFFMQQGNQYLDRALRRQSALTTKCLDRLLIFVDQHFFLYPDTPTNASAGPNARYELHPEVTKDTRHPNYKIVKALIPELYGLADKAYPQYMKYRRLVKRRLQM